MVRELILAGLLATCPMVAHAEYTQVMEVTAYTPDEEENGGNVFTASGELYEPNRTCAADHLPFGTIVEVNGQEWEVMDTFGGGYSDRLDLCMETAEECDAFGVQTLEVVVYDDGGNDDE